MKNVLTIALLESGKFDESLLFGGAEVITLDGENPLAGLRKAKGKYTLLTNRETKPEFLADFLNVADTSTADILYFDNGYAFRTLLLQRIQAKTYLPYSAEIAAILSARNVQKLEKNPFSFGAETVNLSDEAAEALIQSVCDYTQSKGRTPIDVYALARDAICTKLMFFYLNYLLEIFKKTKDFNALVDFDAKLISNDKVLYLVFENRFSQIMDLKKLRAKNTFQYLQPKN